MDGPGPQASSRPGYAAVHGRPRSAPIEAAGVLGSRLAAPLLGSPAVFPTVLRLGMGRLRSGRASAAVPVGAALAYFGPGLLLRIWPEQVAFRLPDTIRDAGGPRWTGSAFLDAGDWRDALAPVEHCRVYVEMQELVAADLDWRATPSYRRAKKAAQQGRPVYRSGRPLADPEALKAYFRRCADLIRSLRSHGLLDRRAQAALAFDRPSHRGARPAAKEWAERDVGVAINADGGLVRHLGGRHRWAAVRALGLPLAPVEIRLVHLAWLERAAAETGLPPSRALPAALARLGG